MPIVTVITTTKEPEVLCSVVSYYVPHGADAEDLKRMLQKTTEEVDGHNIYIDVVASGQSIVFQLEDGTVLPAQKE